jgi:aryl-alcohol dehydrogenase-like predicted oxidoreductase
VRYRLLGRYIGLCNMAAWQIMKALGVSERHGFAKAPFRE